MQFRLPNPWLVAGVAALAGGLTGMATAFVAAASTPLRTAAPVPTAAIEGPQPQIETTETTHRFGRVAVGGSGSYAFAIRNSGAAPLVLTKGATSCTCTVSDFADADAGDGSSLTVPPGQATSIRIEWKGKGGGGPFRQQATILTNDPRRPEIAFSIVGEVVPLWRAEPEAITLAGLSPASATDATATILTFGETVPELVSCRLAASKLEDAVAVAAEPLPPADLKQADGATGGFRVTLGLAAGLPLGKFGGELQTTFRIDGEEVLAAIPFEATVAGDLSLIGPAWDRRAKAVRLGSISRREGFTTKLFLTARGPNRDQVRPTVREVVPAGLGVEIGPPQPVGNGRLLRIEIELSVTPESPTANRLCTTAAEAGRIVLATGQSDTPELTIPVCVAIVE